MWRIHESQTVVKFAKTPKVRDLNMNCFVPDQTALYSYCFQWNIWGNFFESWLRTPELWKSNGIQTLPADTVSEQTLSARFSQSSDGEPGSWTRRVASGFLLTLTKRQNRNIHMILCQMKFKNLSSVLLYSVCYYLIRKGHSKYHWHLKEIISKGFP